MHTRRHRILVIDDDRTAMHHAADVLKGRDYMVLAARSLEHGQVWLADWPIDLLIVPVRLGALDGLQFFRAVRARNPDMAGILIGRGMDRWLEGDARRCGAALLIRPVRDEHLLMTVAERLAAIRRRQRWPRKVVGRRVPMTVGGTPAALVDVSYGGLRFAVRSEVHDWPSPIPIDFPGARLQVDAELVWSSRASDGVSSLCGAAIVGNAPPARWRNFVDTVPQNQGVSGVGPAD